MRRSKLDYINLFLANAQLSTFKSLGDAAKSDYGRRAISIYDKNVERLLSEFPWPFAIRNRNLTRLPDKVLSSWTYVYQIPEDKAQIWDVYVNEANFDFPSTYDSSVYSGFFETPVSKGLAAQEEGYIVSNLSNLKAAITTIEVPAEKFHIHFQKVLERTCSIEMARQSNVDMERLIELKQSFEKDNEDSKRLQSMENPGPATLGPSRMLTRTLSRY